MPFWIVHFTNWIVCKTTCSGNGVLEECVLVKWTRVMWLSSLLCLCLSASSSPAKLRIFRIPKDTYPLRPADILKCNILSEGANLKQTSEFDEIHYTCTHVTAVVRCVVAHAHINRVPNKYMWHTSHSERILWTIYWITFILDMSY